METEANSFESYMEKRSNIFKSIQKQKYQDLAFSEEEEKANEVFRKKLNEQRALLPNSFYREYTLKYLDLIEKSEIFPIMKSMPKGGILHIHLDCCFELEWVYQNLFLFFIFFYFLDIFFLFNILNNSDFFNESSWKNVSLLTATLI